MNERILIESLEPEKCKQVCYKQVWENYIAILQMDATEFTEGEGLE